MGNAIFVFGGPYKLTNLPKQRYFVFGTGEVDFNPLEAPSEYDIVYSADIDDEHHHYFKRRLVVNDN